MDDDRRGTGASMKTSLGIWAFGAMATRFNPGGYKPELAEASTAEKVRTAVDGLGELMDDYEFHYPQELSPDNLDAVRAALDGTASTRSPPERISTPATARAGC